MDTLLSILNWLLPLIYLALAIDYGATFILRNRTHVRNAGVFLAIVFHCVFLVLWGVRFGGLPLVSNYEILSVVALSSAGVYWAIELITRDRRAGVFVFLLIFLLQYTSSMFLTAMIDQAGAQDSHMQYGWGRLHVLPAALAYTALAFGAVYATLYLVGQRNMKHHNFGLLFDRLPPLDLLGRMSFQSMVVGLAFMTVTIITGSVLFSHSGSNGQVMSIDPKLMAKIVIGSMAWVICAIDVFGKYVLKWSVSRVSAIALAGFLIIAALFVTSLALS
ncbi:MAG: cytochrome c biogenesis protein CcsA [Phycisphaerae bacterium]|nr:cytochrome c biogenesis protein CcsA [Phycisphaerae bacterium]